MNLESLIAEVLACDVSSLVASSGRGITDRWDSLAHLGVISAVEETYGVLLSSTQMRECTSIGLLREFLGSKGIVA
jgi:acyl carrier protein